MARGRVRCGACLSVFTATDNLVIGMESAAPARDATGELDELLEELKREPAQGRTKAEVGRENPVRPRPSPAPSSSSPPAPKAKIPGRVLRAIASASSAAPAPQPAAPAAPAPEDETAPTDPPVSAGERPGEGDPSATPAADSEHEEIVLESAGPESPAPAQEQQKTEGVAREKRARRRERPAQPVPSLPAFNLDEQLQLEVAPARKRRWWLLPATLAAALALVGQVLWFQYDAWSRDLRYRPIYEVICPYVGCKLPVMRSLVSIQSRNLVVRSHPEVPGALVVDALLVNEAPYAQPFPLVELRFSSMAGALVAGRRFQPSEYLDGELAGATMMTPNTPVHISLEIEDPGSDAVNYVMVFR